MNTTPQDIVNVSESNQGTDKKQNKNIAKRLRAASVKRASAKAELQRTKIAKRLRAASAKRASAKVELQRTKIADDGIDNEALALLTIKQRGKVAVSRLANSRTRTITNAAVTLMRTMAFLVVSFTGASGYNKHQQSAKPPLPNPPAIAQPATTPAVGTLPPLTSSPKNDLLKKSRAP